MAEVRLPLDLDGVGDVQPFAGLTGVVHQELHAGVAVEVGDPQHGTTRQADRGVVTRPDDVAPHRPAGDRGRRPPTPPARPAWLRA